MSNIKILRYTHHNQILAVIYIASAFCVKLSIYYKIYKDLQSRFLCIRLVYSLNIRNILGYKVILDSYYTSKWFDVILINCMIYCTLAGLSDVVLFFWICLFVLLTTMSFIAVKNNIMYLLHKKIPIRVDFLYCSVKWR